MSKAEIKDIVDQRTRDSGMVDSGIAGVQLFRVTEPTRCSPAVYDPCVVAILGGAKEAILDGQSFVYDSQHYMCCPMAMPVEAGTPTATPQDPLLGVLITLDTRLMTELAIVLHSIAGNSAPAVTGPQPLGLTLSPWSPAFTDALLRLLQVCDSPADRAILGPGRLRELYYAVLTGAAGPAARRAFGVGNDIARAISYLSDHLDQPVTIDALASEVGMSRAVFYRKFKQATRLSPIQFVKSMRLNSAAMKIAGGMTVNAAASDVGYVSASQFSREFKRMYGQSPRQWGSSLAPPQDIASRTAG